MTTKTTLDPQSYDTYLQTLKQDFARTGSNKADRFTTRCSLVLSHLAKASQFTGKHSQHVVNFFANFMSQVGVTAQFSAIQTIRTEVKQSCFLFSVPKKIAGENGERVSFAFGQVFNLARQTCPQKWKEHQCDFLNSDDLKGAVFIVTLSQQQRPTHTTSTDETSATSADAAKPEQSLQLALRSPNTRESLFSTSSAGISTTNPSRLLALPWADVKNNLLDTSSADASTDNQNLQLVVRSTDTEGKLLCNSSALTSTTNLDVQLALPSTGFRNDRFDTSSANATASSTLLDEPVGIQPDNLTASSTPLDELVGIQPDDLADDEDQPPKSDLSAAASSQISDDDENEFVEVSDNEGDDFEIPSSPLPTAAALDEALQKELASALQGLDCNSESDSD